MQEKNNEWLSNISDFVKQELYENRYILEEKPKEVKNKKIIVEVKIYKFIKYLIYETIFFTIAYISKLYKDESFFAYMIWWLLFFNLMFWGVAGLFILLIILEWLEIRRIKQMRLYKEKEKEIWNYCLCWRSYKHKKGKE